MWNPSSNSFFISLWRSRNRNTFITVVMLGFVILCFLLSYNVFGMSSHKKDSLSSLVNVNVLFRHGDRTPSAFYPNDPYKDDSFWPEGLGQLTNKGKSQLYQLGQKLRAVYTPWLPENYSPYDVVVRSSYADRAQMSALALLASLYVPKGKQIWNEDLLWQPIPINSVPRADDNVIVIGKDCPAYTSLRQDIVNGLTKNLTKQQLDMVQYISEKSGQALPTILEIEGTYFTLIYEENRGLKLPSWTDQVFPSKMEPIARLMEASLSWTEQAKAFASGGLIKEFLNSMNAAKQGSKDFKKLSLYSGHDVNIVSLLRTLTGAGRTPPETLPGFGAAVLVELHKVASNYYVQVLYYPSFDADQPETVEVGGGCGKEMCPLEKFIKFVSPYSSIVWKSDCYSTESSDV